MIELIYNDFNHAHMQPAIGKIESFGFSSAITAYKVSRILKSLQMASEDCRTKIDIIANGVAKKDDKGKVIVMQKGNLRSYQFNTPEDEKKFGDAVKELFQTKFTIPVKKLTLEELDGVHFTPTELDAFMCVIEVNQPDPCGKILKMVKDKNDEAS